MGVSNNEIGFLLSTKSRCGLFNQQRKHSMRDKTYAHPHQFIAIAPRM